MTLAVEHDVKQQINLTRSCQIRGLKDEVAKQNQIHTDTTVQKSVI